MICALIFWPASMVSFARVCCCFTFSLFVLGHASVSLQSVVLTIGPLNGTEFETPYVLGASAYPMIAPVVYAGRSCKESEYQQLLRNGLSFENRIVIAEYTGCTPYIKAELAFKHGAIALIIAETWKPPGIMQYSIGVGLGQSKLPIFTFFQFQSNNFWSAVKNNSQYIENPPILLKLQSTPNAWTELYESTLWLATQILCSVLSFVVLCVVIVRLHIVRRIKGCELSLMQTCLSFNICINIVRLAFWSVDPYNSRHILPRTECIILHSVGAPIFMFSTLLVIFYWREINSSKTMGIRKFVSRKKHLFIAFLFFIPILIFDFFIGVSRGRYLPTAQGLLQIQGAVYALALVLIAFFFIYEGRRILRSRGHSIRTMKVKTSKHGFFFFKWLTNSKHLPGSTSELQMETVRPSETSSHSSSNRYTLERKNTKSYKSGTNLYRTQQAADDASRLRVVAIRIVLCGTMMLALCVISVIFALVPMRSTRHYAFLCAASHVFFTLCSLMQILLFVTPKRPTRGGNRLDSSLKDSDYTTDTIRSA